MLLPSKDLYCLNQWCLAVMVVALVMGSTAVANAQRNAPSLTDSGVHLPSNRLDTRGIQRAKELISQGEFSQAIRFLDEVLARAEDSFFAGNEEGYSGLKETARQILRDLPPEGRRIYETTFGPVARRLLQQSVESGDLTQFRQIAQRYFYTPAGHEAALLFAQLEADTGHHLTAALTYQQLLETSDAVSRFEPQLSVLAAMNWFAAENPAQATEILKRLSEQGYRNFRLSGEDSPLRASQNEKADWMLQAVGSPVHQERLAEPQWLTSRGNPARNGQTDGGLPHLRVRWQVRLLEHPNLEAVHEEMAEVLTRQKTSRLPAATPLAAGDYVITRSAHGLLAVDFRSGKRIWQAQPQRENLWQKLMGATQRQQGGNGNNAPAQAFARMIWEDYLYNTLSSDGQRVYVIRDLTLPKFNRSRSQILMPQRFPQSEEEHTNRLRAYDLPTQGKLVWEIDGAARKDDLRGAFFLGAPVTVGQSLYCLAEIKSETAIYLIALDRQTGKLQWRQQLADMETGIAFDSKRRLQASIPSYEAGMLICPTGSGVVVGVDLGKQALSWAYRYPTVNNRLKPHLQLREQPSALTSKRWVHSVPVIANGRVLLTPPESDMLHCLDLVTGKLLWKQKRDESLFLAGVEDEFVLLVGNRSLSALRLKDGQPAWPNKHLDLPVGSTPTGSGFFSKGQYLLPLSNAGVIAVDVSLGKIVAKTSSRDGQLLGNLICYQGAVISQTGRYLDCFEQVDVLRTKSERRRAEDPTDFEALRTLGEIAYNEGDLAQAIALLRKAYASEPEDLRTTEVLGEALVAALDENFAEHKGMLPLLAQLHQGSAEAQLTVLRLQSKGLLEMGRAVEAFEVCLKAYENLAMLGAELSIGRHHQVSATRWLAAQSTAVWAAASPKERKAISDRFAPLVKEALDIADASLRQQLYDCFGTLEQTEPVALLLAVDDAERGDLLAAQQIFLKLAKSKGPQVRNAAIAHSSRLLHEAQKDQLAVSFDAQLRGELADQECLPGLTGLECLEEWTFSSKFDRNNVPPRWPYGRVESTLLETTARSSQSPQTGIRLEQCDDVLGSSQVALLGMISGRNREFMIQDSFGRSFFRAKLDQGTQAILNARGGVYAVSRGNLLILSLGRQIVAFDTLSSNGEPLWRLNTTSNFQYQNQQNAALRWIVSKRHSGSLQKGFHWIGIIGPVTHDSCLFQIDHRLVCVDTLTGEIKWSRSNLPLGSELYGDEHYVMVVPKASRRAMIFSTVDGRSLGETTSDLPEWRERKASVGRNVIRWHKRGDQRWELSAVDTLQGDVLWKYEFEKRAQVDFAQNRFAVVVDSSGRCVVIDIREGTSVVDQPIEANLSLSEVHLLAGSGNFVVSVQQEPEAVARRQYRGFSQYDFTNAFAGQLYLFDRKTGLPVWARPAEVRGLPLMLSQPVDLPVIAFAGNIRRSDPRQSKPVMGLKLLEKASGRVLFHDESLPQSPHRCWLKASETELDELLVEMSKRQVKLKFTNQPRAPEPPSNHAAQRRVRAGSKGLQRIGEKLFGGD